MHHAPRLVPSPISRASPLSPTVLQARLMEQHGLPPSATVLVKVHIGQALRLASYFGSGRLDDLRPLSVLDLGCGGMENPDVGGWRGDLARVFEPHFCRVFAAIGAKRVVGIDLLDNASESFESIQADLLDPALWSKTRFPDHSFDVIRLQSVVWLSEVALPLPPANLPSPVLVIADRAYRFGVDSPELGTHLYGRSAPADPRLVAFALSLMTQVPRLLGEGGLFILDSHAFAKREGHLVPIELRASGSAYHN